MTVTNKLIEVVNKLGKENKIIKGKEINPKNEKAKLFGPFSVQTYADGKVGITNESIIVEDVTETTTAITEELSGYSRVEITNPIEIERLTRIGAELQGAAGLKRIIIYSKNDVYVCISRIKGEQVKLIYYPREDSNVGIYCNNNNVTSYVTDGKVKVVNGKLYNGSANERAMEAFLAEWKENETFNKSFNKFLSDELWQLADKEDTEEKVKVKSLNILGYTKYLNFPQMDDGTPYNVVWLEDGTALGEYCQDHKELSTYIRFSSLSQNGICAMAGKLGPKTKYGYEILPVKQFKGTKGKLDISATQGPKTYKQINYKSKSLVILAEIKLSNHEYALNLMGNCIATKEAFDNYCSDLTRDKGLEHRCKYPAHKIFIKANGEIVRIKGATSLLNMKATLEDGTETNNIVVLPPREFNPDGTISVDMDKFKYLCATVGGMQMVDLVVEGEQQPFKVPAVWCDIYEDAAHSSVYSLKMKEQNHFYYGAIFTMYRNNGWVKMAKEIQAMLDQELLNVAMNSVKQTKSNLVEVDIDDIL